jgi:hypothetical protein
MLRVSHSNRCAGFSGGRSRSRINRNNQFSAFCSWLTSRGMWHYLSIWLGER